MASLKERFPSDRPDWECVELDTKGNPVFAMTHEAQIAQAETWRAQQAQLRAKRLSQSAEALDVLEVESVA